MQLRNSFLTVYGSTRHFREKRLQQLTSEKRCVMSCLRAPEAALGVHLQFATSLLDQTLQKLQLHPKIIALDGAHRARLLQDFVRGKRYILLTLQIKLACPMQLPYALCSLSHHDTDLATQAVDRLLDLYERSP